MTITDLSGGRIALDWTGRKRAGQPDGPFVTLTPGQLAELCRELDKRGWK